MIGEMPVIKRKCWSFLEKKQDKYNTVKLKLMEDIS